MSIVCLLDFILFRPIKFFLLLIFCEAKHIFIIIYNFERCVCIYVVVSMYPNLFSLFEIELRINKDKCLLLTYF